MNENGNENYEDRDNWTPLWTSSLMIHCTSMTFIFLFGIPFGYGLILKQQYFYHSLVQTINVIIIIIFGLYASITFSSGQSEHSKLGKILLILLFSECILALIKYKFNIDIRIINIIKSIHLFLGQYIILPILLPLQWHFGIAHLLEPPIYNKIDRDRFYGHVLPGFVLCYFGMILIWNSNTEKGINLIMFIEMIFAPIAAFCELIGEYYTQRNNIHFTHSHLDHMSIDCMWIFCGLLCILYYLILNDNKYRIKLHHITISFGSFTFGVVLLFHGGGIEEISFLHKICGAAGIIFSVFNLFQKNLICGSIAIFSGVLFTFSQNIITHSWHNGYKYPYNIYIMLSCLLSFYISIINVLFFYINIETISHHQKHSQQLNTNDIDYEAAAPFITK